MALQDGDEEDWGNWGSSSTPIVEQLIPTEEEINSFKGKFESPNKENKWDQDSSRTFTMGSDDNRNGYKNNADDRRNKTDDRHKESRNYSNGYSERRPYVDRDAENRNEPHRNNDRGGNRRDFNDRDGNRRDNNDRGVERRDFNDRGSDKRDFNDHGGDRRDYNDRGGDRRDFNDRGGDRRDFNDRGGDRRDFNDRGGDRRDFNDRGGDRRDFNDRGGDRRDFHDRGGDRRDFNDRGGDRRDFNDRGGDRRDFNDRGGDRQDFNDRIGYRRDYNDRDGDYRDNDRRDFSNRGDRREFNDRGNDNDTARENERNDRRNKRDFNDRSDEKRGYSSRDDRRQPQNGGYSDDDLPDKFQNKANINDDGNSRQFYRGNKDGDKVENNEEPPTVKRATYVPNDDEQDYELHVNCGINFDNYEKIPVEVTGDDIPMSISNFIDFPMPDFLLKNIESMKYTKLTPVQKYAIPIIAAERDLMACAQTGSGKTAAFLLPIIVSLHNSTTESETATAQCAFPKALILAPTRELCRQIFTAARQLCQGSQLKVAYIYGGIEMNKSRRNLQASGCDILVATPGRLIHFMELVWVSLRYLRYFVLDEGDRMLDKEGFFESVSKVSEQANFTGDDRKIQISMFSATFPGEIQNLAKTILKNYLFLTVGMVGSANCDVKQEIIRADQKEKMNVFIDYIKNIPNEKTLIFVQSKRMADFYGIKLGYLGYKATTIHGDREQEQREMALNDFKSGRVNFMVATNVAARGLDIPMVDTVVNIDMPDDIDTYVHRIGRTGRCGNVGRAISFFDENNDIGLASSLVKRLQEANQECPDWLVLMADNCDNGGGGRQHSYTRDNRRNITTNKYVETPNNDFMKGNNTEEANNDEEQSEWLQD